MAFCDFFVFFKELLVLSVSIPNHLAIIMDGNGRWARERKKPRIFGHREGAHRVSEIVEECARLKVAHLSLYAFSEENWNRPTREVSFLMDLLNYYLIKERKRLAKNNIRLETIGNLDKLPPKTQALIEETVEILSDCDGMTLNLALSYSGRDDLTQAAKKIALRVKNGELDPDEIEQDTLTKHMFSPSLPDIDLLIRTSGEQRVSNFMLWHLSYAEMYFCDCYWPDFRVDKLMLALNSYSNRERRFGNVIARNSNDASVQPKLENNLC